MLKAHLQIVIFSKLNSLNENYPAIPLFLFSQLKGNLISPIYFSEWAESREAYWYAYGTLLGESITRDTNSSKAPALRYFIRLDANLYQLELMRRKL